MFFDLHLYGFPAFKAQSRAKRLATMTVKTDNDPKRHILWPSFCEFAKNNCVGNPEVEAEEDWGPWWDCYIAGASAFSAAIELKNAIQGAGTVPTTL